DSVEMAETDFGRCGGSSCDGRFLRDGLETLALCILTEGRVVFFIESERFERGSEIGVQASTHGACGGTETGFVRILHRTAEESGLLRYVRDVGIELTRFGKMDGRVSCVRAVGELAHYRRILSTSRDVLIEVEQGGTSIDEVD